MPDYCMYLRKSRADIEAEARGEGETLARHQAILIELAKRQGLNIVKAFKEIVSGDSIAARPQMQNMLAEITEKKYAGVLVVEVERLARGDTIDQGVVAQAFKQSDTKIITPIKTYDPSNEYDEEYFEFSLFMSRREYKTIKRRMQAGRLASIKEGNYICSRTPYGYKKINPEPKVHTLEIVNEEAEVIRMIYSLYLGGHGAKYISNELNRLGIKPQKSQYWESPSIKKILSNPLYCGKLAWHTKSNGDKLYLGKHEAIISEDIFEAAQQKKKTNPVAQLHPNDALLNYYHGILFCKNCGHQLKRRYLSKYNQEHLLCQYKECRGKTVSSSIQAVDDAVMTCLKFRIEHLSKQLNSEAADIPDLPVPDKRKPLVAELTKALKQQAKLYDLLEQEVYDTNTFLERSELINQKIETLKNSIAEIDTASQTPSLSPEESIIRLKHVVECFLTSNPEEKNQLLKSVARKIYYSKSQRMCRRNLNSDLTVDVDFL